MAKKFLLRLNTNDEHEEMMPNPIPVFEPQPVVQQPVVRRGRNLNNDESEKRMVRVFEMILYERLTYMEFRSKAAEEFNITTRMAENLWREARDKIKEKYQQERNELLENQIERYFNLLNRAREAGVLRVENEILRELNKIYGLDKVNIDVTSGGEPISINIHLTE